MARRLQMYKAYTIRNGEKDPVIHQIHTMLDDTGADYSQAAEASGVSRTTIVEWIEGDTMRPKYCTIAAVAGALGYETRFVKANAVSFKKRRVSA
jgi:transcriptional regulator with XRE-family HTH domain